MRFGERAFDLGYVEWGFHDRATQEREADSLLKLAETGFPLRILDLGCGIGTHAVVWARSGHSVLAYDISHTFIEKAREAAEEAAVAVDFRQGTIEDMDLSEGYDVVTCIEFFPHGSGAFDRISNLLRSGGRFIFDVRNPAHPDSAKRASDWSKWEERDGRFYLERHETEAERDRRLDTWIVIDPNTDLIEEEFMESKPSESKLSLYFSAASLVDHGFSQVEFRTMDGALYTSGEEPYWLWCVASKPG